MWYLLLFHGNNGNSNAPHSHVIRKSSALYQILKVFPVFMYYLGHSHSSSGMLPLHQAQYRGDPTNHACPERNIFTKLSFQDALPWLRQLNAEVTAKDGVPSHVSPCRIQCGRNGSSPFFYPITLTFPLSVSFHRYSIHII